MTEHETEGPEEARGGVSRRSVLGGLLAALVAPALLAKARAGTSGPLGRNRPLNALTPQTPSQAQARFGHSATALPDGRILVAGGWRRGGTDSLNLPMAGAQIHDPASGAWTDAAPMKTARAEHAAVALPDGRVLVTGGLGRGPLASAETYDPATDTWARAAAMGQARYGHAATLSGDRVIVTGGFSQQTLASVLVYDAAAQSWQRGVSPAL